MVHGGMWMVSVVGAQMVDWSVATLFSDVWRSRHTQAHCSVCASTWSRPADRTRGLAVWKPWSTVSHQRLSASGAVSAGERTMAHRTLVWCESYHQALLK